jgi:hypothetical protein
VSEQPQALPQGWELFVARLKALLWKVLTFLVLGLIYWIIVAEGLRLTISKLAMPLYKLPLPGVARLGQFKETRKFDLACVFALVLMVAVFKLWDTILRQLYEAESRDEKVLAHPDVHRGLVMVLSVVLLAADAIMFFVGISHQMDGPLGGGGGNVFISLVATVLYVGLIIFMSLESVRLDKRAGK